MSEGLEARLAMRYANFRLDVDLQLPPTGITALFGPSGSGKTSCLRAIAGLIRGDGFVALDGEVWQDDRQRTFLPTHRRGLAYVFQEGSLFSHLNVMRNLEYGHKRSARPHDSSEFSGVVELFELGPLLDRSTDGLSGGERQRVALARALLTRPRLLLLDEPLATIDMARRDEILPYLERLHAELKIPCLYVSHNIDEVSRLADYLVLMQRGSVVASGPLQDVLSRIDLPTALMDRAGVVIEVTVSASAAADHLIRVEFAGGELFVPERGQRAGSRVRCRIEARDVSLALERQAATSILNSLAARIEAVSDASHPSQLLVRLDASGVPLLAQVTRRSWSALGLSPGSAVWAQVKTVALIG